MVYGTLITDFFGRDRLRRFFWLNALGMAFTDRKDKIKGHCDEVAQNLAQQRRDRSSPTHLGYCHSEATIFRLKVSRPTLSIPGLIYPERRRGMDAATGHGAGGRSLVERSRRYDTGPHSAYTPEVLTRLGQQTSRRDGHGPKGLKDRVLPRRS